MAHRVQRSPAYLSHNRYSYCFRLRNPNDLQPSFGKKELLYSLKTGYLGAAIFKPRLLAGRVQLLFQDLRQNRSRYMKLSDEQIKHCR